VETREGFLACGTVAGRLAEPDLIADAVADLSSASKPKHDLDGETVLITAVPRRADPIRCAIFRTLQRKMGYALARKPPHGARVILISGPVKVAEPRGMEVVHVPLRWRCAPR